MELLRSRRRLSLARRGHGLLKGKQDELLRRFLGLMEDYLKSRRSLHRQMEKVARATRQVRTEASATTLQAAGWPPPPPATIDTRETHILNLKVPALDFHQTTTPPAYGPTQLPAVYDELSTLWRETAPLLVEVGSREKTLLLLADEIERTRRRVNALEFKLIPGLEEGIRAITFKLAEAELGALTRLMRIKDIVSSG
jgi:V/A-type H+-transporting ATPase subunit D